MNKIFIIDSNIEIDYMNFHVERSFDMADDEVLVGVKKAFSIKVRLLTTVSIGSSRPTASCHLQFTLKNPTESSSIHTWAQMTTDDIHKCHAVLLYRAVCLRIAFKKKVEKNWKMITMLHSVEGQASCTDERYFLIIIFCVKLDQK